jgi:hypothetical protein
MLFKLGCLKLYHTEIVLVLNVIHGWWILHTFSGANCSYVANNLIVTLGSNPRLQGNSELQLLNNSKVFREQSDLSLTAPASGKVILITPDLKV